MGNFVLVGVLVLSLSLSQAEPPGPPVIEKLIESLRSNDFAERQRAMEALSSRRASYEIQAALREQLRSKDQEKRQQAAMALAALGADEQAVIDELLVGMGRRSARGVYLSQPERARSFMAALVKVGPMAVPALIKSMDDEKYAGGDLALEALGKIGPKAKDALPAIQKRLVTEDIPTFCRLVEVKWRIDGDPAFAIEKMIPLLEKPGGRQCNAAVRTLVQMQADAKDAMPALVSALRRHKDHNVLWAVGELAPHSREIALPALREAMKQTDLADSAAITLQNLGEPAKELIPLQLKRLQAYKPKDGSDPMRIVYTIVIHGPMAKPFVDDVIALLKHQNPEVRRAAAWGVLRMFADDGQVIAALREALGDAETNEEAARSLKMLEEARK